MSCASTLRIPVSLLQAPKSSPSFQGQAEAGVPSWRYESSLLQFLSPHWVATKIMKDEEGSKHVVKISLLGACFLLCEPLWSSCSGEHWSRFIDRWTDPRDVCDFLRPILEPGLETVLPGPKFKGAGGYHCIVWTLHEREAPWKSLTCFRSYTCSDVRVAPWQSGVFNPWVQAGISFTTRWRCSSITSGPQAHGNEDLGTSLLVPFEQGVRTFFFFSLSNFLT